MYPQSHYTVLQSLNICHYFLLVHYKHNIQVQKLFQQKKNSFIVFFLIIKNLLLETMNKNIENIKSFPMFLKL